MRAALSSFITDANVVEVSKRSKKAKEDVRILLAKTTDTTFIEIFGEFSQAIFTEIENCVCSCVSSSDYNWVKCVSRDKLWSLFHQLRLTKLVTIWKDSFEKMGQERLDPLVEQRVNQTLFEDVLKTFIPDSQPAQKLSQLPTLSPDEENIVRYVAGYVSMKLMKKYEAQSLEVAEEFCECLMVHCSCPFKSIRLKRTFFSIHSLGTQALTRFLSYLQRLRLIFFHELHWEVCLR